MFDLLDLLNLSVMSQEWVAIVRFRDPYLFLTSWGLTECLFVAVAAVFLVVVLVDQKHTWDQARRREILLLFLSPLILSAISFIGVDLLNLSSFVQIQFYRSLVVWKIVLAILFAYYAFRAVQRDPRDYLFNFFLIGIIAATIVNELLVLIYFPFFTLLWLERWITKGRKYGSRLDLSPWLHAGAFLTAFAVSGAAAVVARPFLLPFFLTTLAITIITVLLTAQMLRSTVSRTAAVIALVLLYASNPPKETFSLYPALVRNPHFTHACEWIKQNTQPTDVFIVEPFASYSEEFKFLCERNIYHAWKDGAQVLFDEAYALEWMRRRQLTQEPPTAESIRNILAADIDYVVSERNLTELTEREVFRNEQYIVYETK